MIMPRTWILAVFALLLAVGCSTNDGGEVADRTTSTTSTSTSSSTTTMSTTEPPSDTELAVDAWDTAWELATTEGSRAEQLVDAGVATPDAAAQFVAIASLNDTDTARRQILRHPNTAQADGELAVNDCMFITPPLTTASASFYQGAIDVTGREAKVTGLKAISPSGCIPREINDEVLEDYVEYWRGLDEVSENLKSLDQHRISELTTGQHRENVLAAARRFSESGDELRDDPTLHPEVLEWRNPTTVVILDCQQADPEFGLYADGGRRLPDLPAPVPGQLDLREVTMVLEDGRWKVSDRQGSANTSCEFAPTSFGVPVV
jgi:hypothetical protein